MAAADAAVPWWQWALFVPTGAALAAVAWWARDRQDALSPAWAWRGLCLAVTFVVGPGTIVLGLAASIWTLTA